MLSLVTFIIVRKVLSSNNISTLQLTLVSCHHTFKPLKQSIIPITLLIYSDFITISRCGVVGWSLGGCGCFQWSSGGCWWSCCYQRSSGCCLGCGLGSCSCG